MTAVRTWVFSAFTALVTSWVILGCGERPEKSEQTSGNGAALYGGIAADGAQVGVVKIEWFLSGKSCGFGSGVMLTNEWLLSAAHVLDDPCKALGFDASQLKVTMTGLPSPQVKSFLKGNIPYAFIHPRYSKGLPSSHLGWDAALMKVGPPGFQIAGTTSQHRRWLTQSNASAFYGAPASFYGYSWTAPPINPCPPPAAPCPPSQPALGTPPCANNA